MSQDDNDTVLHEAAHEAIIDREIEEGVGANNPAIEDVAAPSATYVQAEATAAQVAINSILDVLRNNGLIDVE